VTHQYGEEAREDQTGRLPDELDVRAAKTDEQTETLRKTLLLGAFVSAAML